MTVRQLRTTPNFQRQYRRLTRSIQREANETAQQLRLNPLDASLGVKKLEDVAGNLYRVALCGEYRLVYSFTKSAVVLHHIGHRRDVYETLTL